jgi:uncharacterized lipoprotein YbaY
MLQKAFPEPGTERTGVPAPFLTPEEIAKSEVEKEKYKTLVVELVQRNRISLPDDFVVELSAEQEKDALSKLGLKDVKTETTTRVE